jgi:hypothetical protein
MLSQLFHLAMGLVGGVGAVKEDFAGRGGGTVQEDSRGGGGGNRT